MKQNIIFGGIALVIVLGFGLVHILNAPYVALNLELNSISPPNAVDVGNVRDNQIFAGCPCMKRTFTTTEDISQLTDEFVSSLSRAGYKVRGASATDMIAPSRRSMSCGDSNLSTEAEDRTIGICTLVAENRTGTYHNVQVSLRFEKHLVKPTLRNNAAFSLGENESSSYLDSSTKYVASNITIDIRNR